jgi:hypothetical protein
MPRVSRFSRSSCAFSRASAFAADDQSGCNGDQREMIDHVTSGGGVAVERTAVYVPFDVVNIRSKADG